MEGIKFDVKIWPVRVGDDCRILATIKNRKINWLGYCQKKNLIVMVKVRWKRGMWRLHPIDFKVNNKYEADKMMADDERE